jgi:hypothetical protein
MRFEQAILTGILLSCSSTAAFAASQTSQVPLAPQATLASQASQASTCEAIRDGVEYRAFLPDHRRFLYVSVKLMAGPIPAIFFIVDKDFLGKSAVRNDPVMAWWLNRRRPLSFSTDKVKIAWKKEGSFHFITGLFSSDDHVVISQPIGGLERHGDHFEGAGNDDTNVFAFQLRYELPGFDSDAFDVSVPAVSFDGVTVAPPPIHFNRDAEDAPAKC